MQVTGIVSLQNLDQENAFSDSDVRVLSALANSMSVALENARLFKQTQRLLKETEQRAAELAIVNSVQEGLALKLDMQAIYDLVGDKIQETFNVQAVNITDIMILKQICLVIHTQSKEANVFKMILQHPTALGFRFSRLENRLSLNQDVARLRKSMVIKYFPGKAPNLVFSCPCLWEAL